MVRSGPQPPVMMSNPISLTVELRSSIRGGIAMHGKRFYSRLLLVWGLVLNTGCVSPSTRMNPPAVQAPVESQGLFDLQNQVATLEQEIKHLHGEIEEQSHRLDQLDKRQH